MARFLYPAMWIFLFGVLPKAAFAHPAEQGLVLLLPTELYNWGGTLAVVASIVLVSCMPHSILARVFRSVKTGDGLNVLRLTTLTSCISTALFFALIYIGFAGPTDPQRNLLPLAIWTGWWVIAFIIQGMVLNIWRWIDPWQGVCALTFGDADPVLRMPAWFGAWPAVILFLAFQTFMLADIAPSDPSRLATFAFGYWVFTFVGIGLFGAKAWRQVEFFAVLFDLIGSLRIWQLGQIGVPGHASLGRGQLDVSLAVFCITILVSGSFDGLSETFWWLGQIGINPLEFPGRSAVVGQTIMGLFAANAAVFVIFSAAVFAGLLLVRIFGSRTQISFLDAFTTFAITILPIALGYHFAHYFVSFLVQGQYLLAAIGDPLARGWNILSLGAVKVTTGFLNSSETVKPILLAKVGVVVASHIVSIAMAHVLAGRFVQSRRDLVLLQLFLGILMIFYTFFGLWLLSTPRGA